MLGDNTELMTMKQKDWIAEQEEALQQLRLELESAVKEFAKYSDITEKINGIEQEMRLTSFKLESRKTDLARPIAKFPEQYAKGASHLVKDEVLALADKAFGVDPNDENTVRSAVTDKLWKQYCDIRENDPELLKLKAKYQKLWESQDRAKHPFATRYDELVTELRNLRSVMSTRERYIERNRDITIFRQTAKDLKARAEREAGREAEEAFAEKVGIWLASNIWAKVDQG